jgi:hypothetical protein
MLRKTFAALIVAVLGGSVSPLSGQRQGDFLRPQPDQATTRVANRGANFLEIGVGARMDALAGAMTGLVSGVTAMYWNPAGIAGTEEVGLGVTYQDLFGDLGINHGFAGVVFPFASGGLGISYIRLTSGDIPRTTESGPAADDVQFGSNFSWTSNALGFSYGRRLTDRLQVGLGAKYAWEGIDGAQATWWGLDFGTQFNTGLYGLTLGASLLNIGSSARFEGSAITNRIEDPDAFGIDVPVRFNTTSAQLPTSFKFSLVENFVGGADALLVPGGNHSFKMGIDLNDGVDTDLQTSLGLEYNWREVVWLRAGKRWVNEGTDISNVRDFSFNLSFGAGLWIPLLDRHFKFDYAYTDWGELNQVHVFSFEYGL